MYRTQVHICYQGLVKHSFVALFQNNTKAFLRRISVSNLVTEVSWILLQRTELYFTSVIWQCRWATIKTRVLSNWMYRYLKTTLKSYKHTCLYLMYRTCHTVTVWTSQENKNPSRHYIVVPRHRCSTLGRGAFSVAGPMAWNVLPDDLRDPSLSADNFRKTLKMHLFRNALGHLAH